MRTAAKALGKRSPGGWRARTPRELLAALGRVALWAALALVFIRGAGEVLGAHPAAPVARVQRATWAGNWPDEAARALAVEFATAYLTHAQGEDAQVYVRRLTALASPELAGVLVPRFDRGAPATGVRSATAAGSVALDRRRALVTIAATVATRTGSEVRRLTIPVARDDAGGLVVYDLPAVAPAPARARAVRDEEGKPLIGAERAAIEDVLTRFLRAYLGGNAADLAYLVPAGTRIGAASGRHQLLSLASLESPSWAGGGGRRLVLVTVHARDLGSRALYMLRYRIRLVKRDRWYVAGLDGGGQGVSR